MLAKLKLPSAAVIALYLPLWDLSSMEAPATGAPAELYKTPLRLCGGACWARATPQSVAQVKAKNREIQASALRRRANEAVNFLPFLLGDELVGRRFRALERFAPS